MLKITMCAAILFGICGCGGDKGGTVKDYEAFIKNEFDKIVKQNPLVVLDSEFSLDVIKTESLVSPLIGTCSTDLVVPFISSAEQGATMLFAVELKMSHGYQEEAWVMTNCTATIKSGKCVGGPNRINESVIEEMRGNVMEFDSIDEFLKYFIY